MRGSTRNVATLAIAAVLLLAGTIIAASALGSTGGDSAGPGQSGPPGHAGAVVPLTINTAPVRPFGQAQGINFRPDHALPHPRHPRRRRQDRRRHDPQLPDSRHGIRGARRSGLWLRHPRFRQRGHRRADRHPDRRRRLSSRRAIRAIGRGDGTELSPPQVASLPRRPWRSARVPPRSGSRPTAMPLTSCSTSPATTTRRRTSLSWPTAPSGTEVPPI